MTVSPKTAARHRINNIVDKLSDPLAARVPVAKIRESLVRKESPPNLFQKRQWQTTVNMSVGHIHWLLLLSVYQDAKKINKMHYIFHGMILVNLYY